MQGPHFCVQTEKVTCNDILKCKIANKLILYQYLAAIRRAKPT